MATISFRPSKPVRLENVIAEADPLAAARALLASDGEFAVPVVSLAKDYPSRFYLFSLCDLHVLELAAARINLRSKLI